MAKRKPRPDRENREAAGHDDRRLSTSHPRFLDDLQYWIETDRGTALRRMRLIKETPRDPFTGIGKPEPLRRGEGIWSRRLTDEHRFTYRVIGNEVHLLKARFHYEKGGRQSPAAETPPSFSICPFLPGVHLDPPKVSPPLSTLEPAP